MKNKKVKLHIKYLKKKNLLKNLQLNKNLFQIINHKKDNN